ncbi:MAG: hypothetical protein JF606_14070 [Burkholderiales bacterium]|nr:hypothetical protein [Burkholderiales bacterium]
MFKSGCVSLNAGINDANDHTFPGAERPISVQNCEEIRRIGIHGLQLKLEAALEREASLPNTPVAWGAVNGQNLNLLRRGAKVQPNLALSGGCRGLSPTRCAKSESAITDAPATGRPVALSTHFNVIFGASREPAAIARVWTLSSGRFAKLYFTPSTATMPGLETRKAPISSAPISTSLGQVSLMEWRTFMIGRRRPTRAVSINRADAAVENALDEPSTPRISSDSSPLTGSKTKRLVVGVRVLASADALRD